MVSCYLAHCMVDYDTRREAKAVELLRKHGMSVVNPNSPALSAKYDTLGGKGMEFWLGIVRGCDALAYMGTEGDMLGSGVAKEVVEALTLGMPVYLVVPEMGKVQATNKLVWPVLSIQETRSLVRQARNAAVADTGCGQDDNWGMG